MEKQEHLGSELPPPYDSLATHNPQKSTLPISQSTPSAPMQEYPPVSTPAQGYPPASSQVYPPGPVQGYSSLPGQGYQSGPGPIQGYPPVLTQGYQRVPMQEHQTFAVPEQRLYPKQEYQTSSGQGYQPNISGYPPPPPAPQQIFITPRVGPNPTAMLCPNCRAQIVTRIDFEIGMKTHIIAGLMCIFGLGLCAYIPYLIDLAKVPHHYCPLCKAFLGSYSNCDL